MFSGIDAPASQAPSTCWYIARMSQAGQSVAAAHDAWSRDRSSVRVRSSSCA